MTPLLTLENLLSWAIQVLAIAAIGAILPAILRIRHPRSHLIYCYALLGACLVLPFIQPWQHPVVPTGSEARVGLSTIATVANSPSLKPVVSWEQIALWTLLLGIVARGCWFAAGLWQIRRYRASSVPLFPAPESVAAARALVHQDALIYLSVRRRRSGHVRPATATDTVAGIVSDDWILTRNARSSATNCCTSNAGIGSRR